MTRPLLRCERLQMRFGSDPGGRAALRAVSFRLAEGERVVLSGPSGSGKSTLLSILGGLLTPSGGRVLFDGAEVSALRPAARRAALRGRVGLVFQRFLLLPELSAMENVAMGLRLAGHSWPAASRDAARLLAHLGLGDRLHARPSALSFGEQQRVAIARALGSRPRLLLADEPTASLDWEAGRLALDTMVSLARAQRTAVIIATHDPRVLPYATRALHLSDGVLVEDRIVNGPPPDGQQASRRAPALSEPAPWAAAR